MLNIVCKGNKHTIENIPPHVLLPMRGLEMIIYVIILLNWNLFIILNCVRKQITI